MLQPGLATLMENKLDRFPTVRQLYNNVNVHEASQPIKLSGKVIHGFSRGSKLLGTPTANIPPEPYSELLQELPNGIFYGWASLEDTDATENCVTGVYESVMSIGWNPVFKNEKKSIEAYLMKEFGRDFYGVRMKLMVLGFIRLERDFNSLDALKVQIADDVRVAKGKG